MQWHLCTAWHSLYPHTHNIFMTYKHVCVCAMCQMASVHGVGCGVEEAEKEDEVDTFDNKYTDSPFNESHQNCHFTCDEKDIIFFNFYYYYYILYFLYYIFYEKLVECFHTWCDS
eukprot:GHVR01069013.1.p1 GENE.GHVR01069013.1~~GHVR01069013.1.p1  ORF type:complete len:115 (-),score=22.64 GHVR01069013.1:81-425(-)